MTLNEIAYNIKNIVEGGISGDDSNLSLKQIKHMIHYHRAQLLVKYTDSGRYVSEAMLQKSIYNLVGAFSIPETLGFPSNRAIRDITVKKVSGVGEAVSHHVNLINRADKEFFMESRFAPNKSQLFATIDASNLIEIFDNDGEIFSDTNYSITISFILANPTSISEFSDSSSVYPIPAELVGSLVENVLSKEFNIYLRTNADYSNNAVDESGAKMAKLKQSASPNANARSRRERTR